MTDLQHLLNNPLLQLGTNLLQAGGPTPGFSNFGQSVGQAFDATRGQLESQSQADLRRKLIEAQIAELQRPAATRPPGITTDAAGFKRFTTGEQAGQRVFPGVQAAVKPVTAQSGIGKVMSDFQNNIISQDMLNSEFARLSKNDPAKVFAPQRILDENNEIRLQIPRIDSQGNVELLDIGAAPKLTAQQESVLEIEQAREEALIKTEQALAQSRGLKTEAREDKFITDAFAAAGEIQDINRASELIELVNTGGFEAAKASFTDFFGTTPGDVGELRRILAQNVLNGLAVFTGAISEGEREFLSSITTSISQGGEVNKRNLARLRRIANNAIKRGRTILERRGDTETLELFNQALGEQPSQTGVPTGRFNEGGEQLFLMPDGSFIAR